MEDECGLGSSIFCFNGFHITVKICKQRAITVHGLNVGVVISFLIILVDDPNRLIITRPVFLVF